MKLQGIDMKVFHNALDLQLKKLEYCKLINMLKSVILFLLVVN